MLNQKIEKKSRKKLPIIVVVLVVVLLPVVAFLVPVVIRMGLAEQQGSSPESGRPSITMQLYHDLVGLDYGSEDSGSWGDYGEIWNRIFSAALQEDKYLPYDQFDRQNWELYRVQSYVLYDDYKVSQAGHSDYSKPSASFWTNVDTNVWKDERSGLYWSNSSASTISNNFDLTNCSFFVSEDRGSWDAATTGCGDAIVHCRNLDLGGRSDWYLPSQDELYQAYLNGMYTRTSTSFVTDNRFWSSTEFSGDSADAWAIYLMNPAADNVTKTESNYVRCVARD